jgi:O-antigen/teichoic acid export membrane protein
MGGYGREYARHTLLTVAATVACGALFYALRVVLYRHLNTAEYGLFYVVFSAAAVVQPLLSFGFDPGLAPFVTRFRERGDPSSIKQAALGGLVPQVMVGGTLVAVAWVLAGPLGMVLFGVQEAALLIRIVALHAGLLIFFKTGLAVLLGLQSIGARSLSDMTRVLVCVGAAVVLLRLGYGVRAAAYAYVAGAAAGVAVQVAAVCGLHRGVALARFAWRPGLVRDIFRSGKYLSVAYGGALVFSHMDTVMLGIVGRDLNEVGVYQVAVPTITIVQSLLVAAGVSFMPMVTKLLERGERDLLAAGINQIFEAAWVVVLPGVALAACFSDVLMTALFQRDVQNAPEAFNILAIGSVFYFMCYLNLQILAGMGRTRGACGAIGAGLAINLVLNFALIALFGIRGAAAATVLSYVASTALGIAVIREELAVRVALKRPVASIVASAALAVVALQIRKTGAFMEHPIAVAACGGAALYAMCLGALELSGYGRLTALGRAMLGPPVKGGQN